MSSKTVLFFFAQVFLIQISFGQVIPAYSGNSLVENNVVVNSGGGLGINSGLGINNGLGVTTNMANNALTSNALASSALASSALASSALASSSLASSALASSALASSAPASSALSSLSTGQGYVNLASISGGGVLPVTSYSPIAPGGLTVVSENTIEGPLLVSGQLPFLSAVGFEGALNTDGAGAASCGCGSGSVGITSESYGSSVGGVGYSLGGIASGLGGRGLGGLRL